MAGRSGSLVSADSSRRQTPLERGSRGDVSFRQAAALGVPRDRARWARGLVPLRSQMVRRADGRPWFIHGVGFDITDLKRTEEALQEERNFVVGDPGHGGRAGGGARSAGADRALQSRLRTDHRVCVRRSAGQRGCGTCFCRRRDRDASSAMFEQLRAAQLAGRLREPLDARASGARAADRAGRARAARTDARRLRVRHRHRNRHYRAQATGAGHPGNQRRGSSGASGRICTTAWASI